MADLQKISNVIKKSCDAIEDSIREKEKEDANVTDVIRSVITIFFDELKRSGFSMDLDEFIETKMEQKTKKSIDLAKESLDSFKKTNGKIQGLAQQHTIEIERITDETNEIDVQVFRERFSAFQHDLMSELEHANDVIHRLEKEIEELQRQSNIDPLTKLYNRKALELDSHEFLKHSQERALNLVGLMIDVDDFKRVNDQFGHVAGDKVLMLLAKLFKTSIREYDRAYRYGGEEFLIIFNRTTKEEARKVAERIMNLVRNNKLIYKNEIIRITLSMGMTEHQKGDTLESIVERADAALYEAKRTGKDKLVIR